MARSTGEQTRPDTAGQERTATSLIEALGHFGVQAKVIGTVAGPHITRYELRLAPGTKVAKVAQLKDDLAYALAATDIRILAPIPGKQAVGVEVPNAHRQIVKLGDVFQEPPKDWSPLTVWLGKDVAGKAIGADLAKMPHLLVAGTTGAGKSGAINAMLSSVLLRATPHEVRLVLVDPKQVELNHYESIPHLLTPVITSPRMAANALQNLVKEMEQRYGIMSMARTRSLIELNKARAKRGEAPLPYILCVIDELADLMMVAPADVEDSIIRLAQKARAVGIHLVLATQSPRVDVITGHDQGERAFTDRLCGILADRLARDPRPERRGVAAGAGRHAVQPGGHLAVAAHPGRLHRRGADREADGPVAQARASRSCVRSCWRRSSRRSRRAGRDEFDPDEDPLLRDAITLVAEMQTASTSMLQRRLRLGYTRAGRVIDMLERRGVISGYEGSKPRQVLITEADLPRMLAALEPDPPSRRLRLATSLRPDMPEIGATLREARMSARIDVSEIEAQTKIRAKYLRALENEEWDLLPGPTFVQELPAHIRPGVGVGREGARRGIPTEPRAPERGGAGADRLDSAEQPAEARPRAGAALARVHGRWWASWRCDRAADRRPAERGREAARRKHHEQHHGAAHAKHGARTRHQPSSARASARAPHRRSWRCR